MITTAPRRNDKLPLPLDGTHLEMVRGLILPRGIHPSDHHHTILTMLKTTFQQKEPKCFIYRDYKNFIVENFKSDLQEALQSCKGSYDAFDNYFTSILNKHAPKKKKVLRGNEKPHMKKNLRRAIMKGSKLKNKGNKTKHPLDIINYKNNVIM